MKFVISGVLYTMYSSLIIAPSIAPVVIVLFQSVSEREHAE